MSPTAPTRPPVSASHLVRTGVLAGIAALLALTGVAHAFTLGMRQDYAMSSGVLNVTIADVNGDGRPDVIATCFNTNQVAVLLGTGGGRFAPAVNYAVPSGPAGVVVVDLNGDGHPDLVVTCQSAGSLATLYGDGNGGFAPPRSYVVGSLPSAIAVGDFNEDGHPDVAVTLQGPGQVAVLLGNGDGSSTWASQLNYTTGSTSTGVAVGDFDGDGHLDLAVANHLGNSVTLLHGDGTGAFGTPATLPVTAPYSVAAADLNGDGILDLVCASNTGNTVSVWLGPVSGAATSSYAIGGSLGAVAVGGLEGGVSHVDIIVADIGGNSAAVLNGAGNGTFGAPVLFATGAGADGVAVADVNGDGVLDIVTGNASAATVTVLLGNNPGLGSATQYALNPYPVPVVLADVNHDGNLDAIVGNTGSTQLSVLLGDGAGGLGPRTDFTCGGGVFGVAVADFNGDGNLDVATPDGGFNTLSVLMGNGAGSFGTKTDYPTGAFPCAIVSVDLNHDGHPDLVVADTTSNTVSILINSGTGTFGAKTDVATGLAPNSIATGDFNGDGNPDIVVTNGRSNSVSVLLGNGTGGLGANTDFPTGIRPVSVAVGDVNGDGKLDLVVANKNSSTVSVLLGNGSGGFAAKVDYPTRGYTQVVAIHDMNGDGLPDLVVGDLGVAPPLSILPGTGNGSFGSANVVSTSVGDAFGLAIADLNGDGRPDIVATEYSSYRLAVLPGLVPTRIAVAVTPNPVVHNSASTITATVSVPAPGYGAPSGMVVFYDGTTPLGTSSVAGGIATLPFLWTGLGVQSVRAQYLGDSRFEGSYSNTSSERVAVSASASLETINDVPKDQGDEVRIAFAASPFDFLGSGVSIMRYDVFRRATVIGNATRPAMPARANGDEGDLLAGWDFVASVPANNEREYDLVAPTVADSNGTGTHWTAFMVRASTSTPGVYYDSAADSGYAVDNLPPAPPAPFMGTYSGGATQLHWGANTEPDLWYYRVYRGGASDFVPGSGNLIAASADTAYADAGPAGSYYKLSAVDVNGNESGYSTLGPGGITSVGDAGPAAFALDGARPNPAVGGEMSVHFSLDVSGPAALELVDIMGRQVLRRDVGGFGVGAHVVDLGAGHTLAPGVYLLRLRRGDESRTTRVAVVK